MLEKIPYPVGHFLGYRKPGFKAKPIPLYRVYFWSFLASWISISVISCIYTYGTPFKQHNTPMIIASFGASAVLVYAAIDAPLAQPRNVFFGHVFSSFVGVVIAQLFLGIKKDWSPDQYTAVQWVGGATAMALSLLTMQLTKTVHPPGGATALIAVVTDNILEIKWYYIGVVTVGAIVQIAIACLINNVERKYPQYWWEPSAPSPVQPPALTPHKSPENQLELGTISNRSITEDDTISSTSNEITEKVAQDVISSSISLDQAIFVLQSHQAQSKTPFALVLPNSQIISTPGFLNPSDINSINAIINK